MKKRPSWIARRYLQVFYQSCKECSASCRAFQLLWIQGLGVLQAMKLCPGSFSTDHEGTYIFASYFEIVTKAVSRVQKTDGINECPFKFRTGPNE